MIQLEPHTHFAAPVYQIVTIYDDGDTEIECYSFPENAERAFTSALHRENCNVVYMWCKEGLARRMMRQGRAH